MNNSPRVGAISESRPPFAFYGFLAYARKQQSTERQIKRLNPVTVGAIKRVNIECDRDPVPTPSPYDSDLPHSQSSAIEISLQSPAPLVGAISESRPPFAFYGFLAYARKQQSTERQIKRLNPVTVGARFPRPRPCDRVPIAILPRPIPRDRDPLIRDSERIRHKHQIKNVHKSVPIHIRLQTVCP